MNTTICNKAVQRLFYKMSIIKPFNEITSQEFKSRKVSSLLVQVETLYDMNDDERVFIDYAKRNYKPFKNLLELCFGPFDALSGSMSKQFKESLDMFPTSTKDGVRYFTTTELLFLWDSLVKGPLDELSIWYMSNVETQLGEEKLITLVYTIFHTLRSTEVPDKNSQTMIVEYVVYSALRECGIFDSFKKHSYNKLTQQQADLINAYVNGNYRQN